MLNKQQWQEAIDALTNTWNSLDEPSEPFESGFLLCISILNQNMEAAPGSDFNIGMIQNKTHWDQDRFNANDGRWWKD